MEAARSTSPVSRTGKRLPLEVAADAPEIDGKRRTGSRITFHASAAVFTMTEYNFETLEHRLRELAFLNSGVRLKIADRRGVEDTVADLRYEGGLRAFVSYLDRAKQGISI